MINKILEKHTATVEREIDNLFPEISAPYKSVCDASRYSLLLGGKRIRPALMLEFARVCGGEEREVLPFAVALEMIHTYSLIHDDLPCMDNDDMRRGKPACHIEFGEDIALLAGDTLLTESFGVALTSSTSDDKKLAALSVLAKNAGLHGMIGGQVMDLSFEKTNPTADELKEMYLLKTGALLKSAAQIGCILAGADCETQKKACEYAENLGLAFQIIDDILDLIGDQTLLGKPIGSDEANNKTTFVTLYGLEKAKELAKEFTNNALAALECFKGDTTNLKLITNYLLDRKF